MPRVQSINFVRDVVGGAPPHSLAIIERTRDGRRVEHTFGALAARSQCLAGTLAWLGVRPHDVVLTLLGNRVEWVETMLACFSAGFSATATSPRTPWPPNYSSTARRAPRRTSTPGSSIS